MSTSIFNYDNNLPGVVTEIDSHLSSEYDTSLFGTTDGVIIVGTAFDGPVGLPTPVYSVEHAIYLFGKPYDSKTRREASIVAGIQEAWNKGCRTIYAMRINGVELYKDFEFCTNNGMKLRIQSRYPSNVGKQCFLKYDNSTGEETFTIYKPASRATINEKMNGLVESENSMMSFDINVGLDYSFDKNSKLVDVIELVNGYVYNNVLEMEIVDAEGNVVTNSAEAKDIALGDVFPGVYFIGRGQSACEKITDITTNMVIDGEDVKPYSSFEKKYYRVLNQNTDVAKALPIYYTSLKEMREILANVGITMNKADDYLAVTEETNKAFPEDKVDYEETNMTAFEKYVRLGDGFATTAIAERRVDGEGHELTPKIKQTPSDDAQHIVPTGDGIYAILNDVSIKYHVLGHDICANTVISGKLPKPDKFKTTVANSVELMNGLITATKKVDADEEAKEQSYDIRMYNYKDVPTIAKNDLFTAKVVESIGFSDDKAKVEAAKNVKAGEKCLLVSGDGNVLYVANAKGVFVETQDKRFADKVFMAGTKLYVSKFETDKLVFTEVAAASDINADGKKYVMVQEGTSLFIADIVPDFTNGTPFIATAEVALDEENDEDLFVSFQDHAMGDNIVTVSYPHFDTTTLSDFVELLNKSELGELFNFVLTQKGLLLKDDYVVDADKEAAKEGSKPEALAQGTKVTMEADRVRGYDYSKRIAYTTTDNFARHLAQHCTYTELKTFPTHGVIGLERVTDVSKTNLAKLVQELRTFNWSMYAKNNYGSNMLTENNLPYSIGRYITTTGFQEAVTVNNYNAILNGAAAYAGLISQLSIDKSSTAQTIDVAPAYEFSRTQLQALSALGIVTVRNSFTKGYIITDGITMAASDDLLRRLFNTRVMHYVEDLIRAACEPFIGTANNIANRNSLQTAIKSKLTPLVDNLLRRYEFKISDDSTVDQYTYIDVNYTIVPMNEIREIRNYMRVQNN